MLNAHTIAGTIVGAGLVVIFTGNAAAGFFGMTATMVIYGCIDIYKQLNPEDSLSLDKD